MTRFANADQQWQPATRSLTTELPALMNRMHADGFEIYRVMYNPQDWDESPRRADINRRTVKLGWFRSQDRGVITVVDGSGRNRIRVITNA